MSGKKNCAECKTNFKASPIQCDNCDTLYCSLLCQKKNREKHKNICIQREEDKKNVSEIKKEREKEEESPPVKSINNYQVIRNKKRNEQIILGKGAFGEVKLAKKKIDNKLYAIKIVEKKILRSSSTNSRNINREITLQKKLNHPNILKLYEAIEDERKIYIVLELANRGSLFSLIKKNKYLTEDEAFIYFFQACLAIHYLQKKNMIHRDIKPENLLMTKNSKIKLSDFGFAVETKNRRKSVCGTVEYMAPELLRQQPYSERIDNYALGILLFEMLYGKTPFKGMNMKKRVSSDHSLLTFPKDLLVSNEAKDLIINLTKEDPDKRLGIIDIFEHDWMQRFLRNNNINYEKFLKSENLMNNSNNEIMDESYVSSDFEEEICALRKHDARKKRTMRIDGSSQYQSTKMHSSLQRSRKNLDLIDLNQEEQKELELSTSIHQFDLNYKEGNEEQGENVLELNNNELDQILKSTKKKKDSFRYTAARDKVFTQYEAKFHDLSQGKEIDSNVPFDTLEEMKTENIENTEGDEKMPKINNLEGPQIEGKDMKTKFASNKTKQKNSDKSLQSNSNASFKSSLSENSNDHKKSEHIKNKKTSKNLNDNNRDLKVEPPCLIENVDFIKFQRSEELGAKNNLIEKKLKEIDEELKRNDDKLKFMRLEEEYQQKKQKNKEIDRKKERIFDALQKMEMGHHKKLKMERKQNDGQTWERDCVNSTYSNKTYDELSLKEKIFVVFGCLIRTKNKN